MRFEIDLTSLSTSTTLSGVDEFTSFDVQVVVPDHVWVKPEEVLRLAGNRASDPQWRAKFDGMVAYATSKGWVDEAGRIRAHVEGAPS